MRIHRPTAIVLLLLLLAPGSGPAWAEPVTLRLKLPPGQVHHMQMTAEQQIELPDRDTSIDQHLSTALRFEVVEVESDGTQTLTVTYTHVALKQQGPMGPVNFDSSHPPAKLPLTAQPFAALVDQQFSVSLSPKGQVRALAGLDAIVEKMLAGLNMGDGPAKAAMEKGIREQFGPEAMKQNLQNMLNVYPDKPVDVGDGWTHTAAMKQGLPLIAETTYTVSKITADTVTLAADSRISPNPHAEPMDMGALKLEYLLGGTQSGTMELDRATGWTKRSKMTQSFTGRMKMSIGQQTVDEPITINGTVTLTPMDAAEAGRQQRDE